jgi:hypothetical protein
MRSRVETCLSRMDSEGDVAYGEAIAILSNEAPTVLVRELRRLLSLAGSAEAVEMLCDVLCGCADQVPLRVLMAARAQLADNGATYPRAAFSKGGTALIIDREPGHLAVEDEVAEGFCELLDEAVERRCAQLGSWSDERVWIDAVLDDVLVPDGLRSTSGGLVAVERGSRLPLGGDNGDVVRLFVHWKEAEQRTDLDLSAIVLDDDFNVISHVDWTNLTEFGMTHSGDITSSEVGAEEFIDVDLVKMSELARVGGGRYVAMCVLRFAGETFDELDEGCAGWMLRRDTTSDYKTFDVSTVSNAFALSGRARTAVPFMIDVVRGEAVYLDIALWGAPMACLSRDGEAVSALVRAAVGRAWTKMSLTDLALYHALSRGADVVEDYEDATITFGTDAQCSYDGLHPERILAELL